MFLNWSNPNSLYELKWRCYLLLCVLGKVITFLMCCVFNFSVHCYYQSFLLFVFIASCLVVIFLSWSNPNSLNELKWRCYLLLCVLGESYNLSYVFFINLCEIMMEPVMIETNCLHCLIYHWNKSFNQSEAHLFLVLISLPLLLLRGLWWFPNFAYIVWVNQWYNFLQNVFWGL